MNIHLTARDVYRTSDVKRWGIVRTSREQTVAEHSYHVAMIACRICNLVGEDPNRVLWTALTHDLPEVMTGDIATPLKDLLGEEVNTRLKDLENKMTLYGVKMAPQDETIAQIVKLADLIEAAAFISEYGCGEYADTVRKKLVARVEAHGNIARQVLYEILHGKQHYMDDYID